MNNGRQPTCLDIRLFLILFLLSLASLPSAARAQVIDYKVCEKPENRLTDHDLDHWHSCRVDSDCAQTYGICGFPKAINHAHLEDQGVRNSCLGPLISCVIPPAEFEPTVAKCVERRCVLQLLELPASTQPPTQPGGPKSQ